MKLHPPRTPHRLSSSASGLPLFPGSSSGPPLHEYMTNEIKIRSFNQLPTDVFVLAISFLESPQIGEILRVAKAWLSIISSHNQLWMQLAERLWVSKIYIPSGLRILSSGFSGIEAWKNAEKARMASLPVKDLRKQLLNHPSLSNQREVAACFEKSEFVNLLYSLDTEKPHIPVLNPGRNQNRPMNAPLRNPFSPEALAKELLPGECPAKGALRMSLKDRHRTQIAEEELTSFTFHIRLRSDGPFSQVSN